MDGYFENRAPACVRCMAHCATCTQATSCSTCRNVSTRNTSGINCPCLTGYFDSGALDCGTCDVTCQTCSLSSKNCTYCDSKLFRYLQGSRCLCILGYTSKDGVAMCQKCPSGCQICDANFNCFKCITDSDSNYILHNQRCAWGNVSSKLSFIKQDVNLVYAEMQFSSPIAFLDEISKVITITVD